jgi:hypothetical protein
MGRNGHQLVLDKLMPPECDGSLRLRLDIGRSWKDDIVTGSNLAYEIGDARQLFFPKEPISIVDDAAYSGGTLELACERVRNHGGTIGRLIVCAAREKAMKHLKGLDYEMLCQHVVPDGLDILHLRDFFPWLPLSGRKIYGCGPLVCDKVALEYRLAPVAFRDGEWLHLRHDPEIRLLTLTAARSFVLRLDKHLGRPARVRDLPLLGEDVGIPLVTPNVICGADTPLHKTLVHPDYVSSAAN